MKEQEAKELELFTQWWNKEGNFGEEQPQHIRHWILAIAEQTWFARSKLDKDNSEKEINL